MEVRQEAAMKELQDALERDMKEEDLQRVVAKVEKLYLSYYDAIDEAAKQDVLQVVTPSWKTPLEKAFLWLGEWRPSAAYQLVYALAGQKVEEELADLLAGIETPSLASLSAAQLSQISEMQTRTLQEEEVLQHHKALLQQSIAGQPILGLVQAIKKAKSAEKCTCKERGMYKHPNDFLASERNSDDQMNGGHIEGDDEEQLPTVEGGHENDQGEGEGHQGQHEDRCRKQFTGRPAHVENGVQRDAQQEERSGGLKDGQDGRGHNGTEGLFKCVMHEKLKRLEELSLRADSLRSRTLTGLLEVLNTVQSAQFLLAASQLQMAVRDIGEKMKQNSQVLL